MINTKKYFLTKDWKTKCFAMAFDHYANNNNLYIELYCDEDYDDHETPHYEPYAALTVNLWVLAPRQIAVDINNFPDALDFITQNDIWKVISYEASGFVTYPIVQLNDEFVKAHMSEIYS